MSKTTYILAVMLFSAISYGQQITFQENVNYRANVLTQSLDENAENLLLESKTEQIIKVNIFNDDYSKSIDVNSNKIKIDLTLLPIGSFVIQAKLDQKWITMSLQKKEDENIASSYQNENALGNHSLANVSKPHKISKKIDSFFYWVVSESNSSFGSSKSMRLEYKEDVAKLISKAKLELQSEIGKNNMLLIYEIYDKSQFMTKQLRDPEYYKSKTSNIFNVVPIYTLRN